MAAYDTGNTTDREDISELLEGLVDSQATASLTRYADQPNFSYWGEYGDWYIVTGQHRDSDALTRSNFRVIHKDLLARFGEEAVTVERARNWLVGWSEALLVNPKMPDAVQAVIDWRERLDGYPVADDEDWSALELENHDNDICGEDCAYCHDEETRL